MTSLPKQCVIGWLLLSTVLVAVCAIDCWYCGSGDMGGGVDYNLNDDRCFNSPEDIESLTCLYGFDSCSVSVRYDYLGRLEGIRRGCANADTCTGYPPCEEENPINTYCMECCEYDLCNMDTPAYDVAVIHSVPTVTIAMSIVMLVYFTT
ncbi:uncharacterized protein LOC100376986 [Saccoglossus kowalevskii]|uniref:Uncharacterized protein LOC100376986 n=1 Tax=Saccoglossus kowalevskii TaxID=10224 RepID=A0ABM0MMQ7_SACKO|nr:PREDICTED: uncharacterized protein LOC100376986 [Saccoglossus kowalevskii]